MPIEILYPKAGTAKKLTKLPRQFVAVGTKDADQTPLGVMISVDAAGIPDGKYRIGSESIVFKPDARGIPQERKMWVLKFRMPAKVKRHQRFVLVVFDAKGLPASVTAQNPLASTDYLAITRENRLKLGADRARPTELLLGLLTVNQPVTGVSYSKDDFFAYGTVPVGNTDVDGTQTELVDTNDDNNVVGTNWGSTDESGFWVMFFDPITGMTNALLTVVYTPNEDQEEVPNIGLAR